MIEHTKNYDNLQNTVNPFDGDVPQLTPIVEDVNTLVMIIFNEAPYTNLHHASEFKRYVAQSKRYVIKSLSGKEFDGFNSATFKGGMNITAQKIKIYIQYSDHSRRVFLHDFYSHNLLDFILKGYFSPKYCCTDFVQQMHGMFKPESVAEVDEEWIGLPIQANEVKTMPPGNAILLADKVEEQGSIKGICTKHFAMALDPDLYISVLGVNGVLGVMEFDQMHKIYPADSLYLLVPRSVIDSCSIDLSSIKFANFRRQFNPNPVSE